jgi:hypothetical protein
MSDRVFHAHDGLRNMAKGACDMDRRVAGPLGVASYPPLWMEIALQLIILLFAAFLLNACAAQGPVRTQTAALAPGLSEEVSCMSDCLDDDSETCDSCAASCLDAQRGDQVALGR